MQLNLNGPLKGKGFYVKRIVDSAGGPANRSYKVDWSHPLDPSPGLMPGDEDYIHWEFDPVVHPPGHAATWEHDCNVGRTAKRAIIAYFKTETRPGFSLAGPCSDPSRHCCAHCNKLFEEREDKCDHERSCESKPSSRSGTKAHAATKRHLLNTVGRPDVDQVRLLGLAGDDDAIPGGTGCDYCMDGTILGAIVSGDGSCMPAVSARMAVGRASFNQLYRVFKRKQLTMDTKLRFYESFVLSMLHGSVAWVYGTTVQRAINGWNASMLSTITDRSVQQECSSPTIALVERLVCRQVRAVGKDLRRSDDFPNRIALLRTRFQIELGLVKKEDTVFSHALDDFWGPDCIPTAAELIKVAGGHYDQTLSAVKARQDAAMASAGSGLKLSAREKLEKQRDKRSQKRNWGERARVLIADLPAGGYVLGTDGGSNPWNRAETGWGVVVLRKSFSGHPVVVAELFGPVTTEPYDDYYVGSSRADNDTAELEAAYQALLWLRNDGTHVPAVIISDSERALTAMDGLQPVIGEGVAELFVGHQGGVNVLLATRLSAMFKRERDRRRAGLDLAHVKGHSGCPINDRADALANLGKGRGPYSRQIALTAGYCDEDRVLMGDGYPHFPVPGIYSCAWATSGQREASLPTRYAIPPFGVKRKGGRRRDAEPDLGSGINHKLFGKTLSWRGTAQKTAPDDKSSSTTSKPRQSRLSLKRIAGTPGAELYNMSLIAHARNDCLTDLPSVQQRVGELRLIDALCSQSKIISCNRAVIEHWNDLVDGEMGGGTHACGVYGSPAPFMRAQPFLRRNARTRIHNVGDLDRSAHVHLKIIKLKYSTDVKHRDIRVKKCIRANDALNDFEYSDTMWTAPATIRYRKAHLQHRSLPGRYLGPDPTLRWSYGEGTGLGGAPHIHQIGHSEGYPRGRMRRVYGGHADDRDERGSGPSQEEVTWARYYGIRSVTLPNVRLGMRNPPTATDWRRFWNATAAEPVLRADTRATRRKERRRLQREWQQACQGKPASSKRAAIPPDLVKAASLRRQLDAWVDDDCDDGEGDSPASSEGVDTTTAEESSLRTDQHGSSASMNDRGGENANSSATHGGDDDLEKGQQRLRVMWRSSSRRKMMQPQRARGMQRADLSEHSESAIGGQDSQVSEVWSQATETFDEPGEDDAALPLGRAGKSETNTVDDDEDAARHQDGPSGSVVMAPRAHSSRRARSSGWGGSLT